MAQSPLYRVNELAHDADVTLDGSLAEMYLKYAGLLVARGYVQSSLGNMVIRAPHPNYSDGVCCIDIE